MLVRMFEKGGEPPPSSANMVGDMSTDHLPGVGDVIHMEAKNAEVVGRYRVVSRLFRTPLTGETAEIALEVEAIEP